jgi:hypothetical protein
MNQTPGKYFENPAFREYIFLLVELARLFREGRGQSSEADAIREAMDFPSHRFDADEDHARNVFADYLTQMSEQYASILLPTEWPTRPPPDGAVGQLPPLVERPGRLPTPDPDPRPRELT